MNSDDILAIHQLLALYGHAVDRTDPQLLAEVFSEDAVFDATPCGLERYVGREAIVKWFELGKPPHPLFHVTTNFYVYEAPDGVRALSKWTIANSDSGTVMNGDYEDKMVNTEDGWRIRQRIATARFLGPGVAEQT